MVQGCSWKTLPQKHVHAEYNKQLL